LFALALLSLLPTFKPVQNFLDKVGRPPFYPQPPGSIEIKAITPNSNEIQEEAK
jgi:hypothetical protein